MLRVTIMKSVFAVFSNFNFFMAGGAIADVLPLGTGVAARVRDPTPFF